MATTAKKREPLESQIGRPGKGVLSSFHPEIVKQIHAWRQNHPNWGARTLRVELENCPRFDGLAIPGKTRIADYLKEVGLSQAYEKRATPDDVNKLPKVKHPHQRWQLDAKGNEQLEGIGAIALIDIKDVFSRLYTAIFPALMSSIYGHPSSDDYRIGLRGAFCEHGLPQEIQCDHASVFFDNRHFSPFPTRMHLWLIALGIRVLFSCFGKPTDQALVERQHLTAWLQTQCLDGFALWKAFYEYCQQRRHILNYQLPCASLRNQAPLQCFPQAIHSGRFYRPEREKDLLDLSRVDSFLAARSWQRQINAKGHVKVANHSYGLKNAPKGQMVTVSFDAFTRHFYFRDPNGLLLGHRLARGLEKKDLMGDYPIAMPTGFQLQIPFDIQSECLIRLYRTPLTTR